MGTTNGREVRAPEEESWQRASHGILATMVRFVAAGTSLFALLYVSGVLPTLGVHFLTILYNAWFMSGIIVVAVLVYPARKGKQAGQLPWYDILLILASLASTAYVIVNALEIDTAGRLMARPMEVVLGSLITVVILEVVRRTLGWPMVIITVAFILYAKFSHLFPGILAAHLQTWPRIMAEIYLTPSGIFGHLTTLASSIIVAFVAFGIFFMKLGGAQFLVNLAMSLAGVVRGGPAKVAIVSSAMFGTFSGSATSNIAVTGSITIPMMKRIGYPPAFAGAVETIASTGGLIMPPIMGSVIFIMATLLETSYRAVAIAAAIPAVLYFTSLFIQTDLRAARIGLKGVPRSELPSLWATLRGGWEFTIPFLALVVLLFALRYPPPLAASYAIGILLLVTLFRKRTRINLSKFIDALAETTRSLLMVAPLIAAGGIIISTLGMTGVGPKLASALVDIAGGSMIILAILAALACLIMGMGVSIIVTYILLALLVAPALIALGVPEIVAHFFILYMGLTMFFTPPYAPGCFVAASFSGSSPYSTCFQAMRLGIVTYLVPFILIYNPALLLIGNISEIVLGAVTAVIGVFALSVGVEGYLFFRTNWLQRILAVSAGIIMIMPGLPSDLIGIGILAVVVYWQWHSKKNPGYKSNPN